MGFREQLKGLIDPAKAAEADKVLDALDQQLDGYDSDIKALKKSLREKDGVKPEDLERLETENAELKKANADQARALKKAETDAKTATETAASYRERTHKLVRDDGLRKELVAQNVRKEYLDAAHALLREGIQVDDEKGEAFALVKDKDGKESRVALGDYVKTWASSDTGKNFVGVPPSSGGGSSGGSANSGGSKTKTRAEFDAMDPAARMEFSKAGGTLTE